MAFRSRACTVSEGWPPVLSHFFMLGASRLVSLDIGSYQPKYCVQHNSQPAACGTGQRSRHRKLSSPPEPFPAGLAASLWPPGGRTDAVSCRIAEIAAAQPQSQLCWETSASRLTDISDHAVGRTATRHSTSKGPRAVATYMEIPAVSPGFQITCSKCRSSSSSLYLGGSLEWCCPSRVRAGVADQW